MLAVVMTLAMMTMITVTKGDSDNDVGRSECDNANSEDDKAWDEEAELSLPVASV